MATLLAACPPPGGVNPGGDLAKTYTTTVSGSVVTPARAADPTKGTTIATARVWACTDPASKITVGTDGSYSLKVVGHSGTFTLCADYTATDGNYKAGAPQVVTTTATAHTQNVPLAYGHTTTATVQASLFPSGLTAGGTISNGVTIVITTEGGHEVGRGITSGIARNAVITVNHPRFYRATARRTGYRDASVDRSDGPTTSFIINLAP